MPKDKLNVAFCPGCAKRVSVKKRHCKHCGYEWNYAPPSTIRDLIEGSYESATYDGAKIDLYVKTIFDYLDRERLLDINSWYKTFPVDDNPPSNEGDEPIPAYLQETLDSFIGTPQFFIGEKEVDQDTWIREKDKQTPIQLQKDIPQ